MPSPISYAKSGDVHIAYRTVGTGPIDLVVVEHWFSNAELEREVPPLARFNDRLAAFGRVILLDKRGVGLSDPVPTTALPSIEEWMDDLRAVMDAVGSERAAVIAGMAGGFMATVFAATYPERVTSLVLVDAFARLTRSTDYPWGLGPDDISAQVDLIGSGWGAGVMLRLFAPDLAGDISLGASWGRYERHSVPPGSAMAMVHMLGAADVRAVLPAIRVPTLVIARDAGPIAPDHGRYLADRIPDAAYVEVRGTSSLIWSGDQEAVISEIQQFITGARPLPGQDRVLATILFTDIVASTERASSIGDAKWRDLLGEHDRIVRTELDRFRGREVKTTGDGFLAVFDGPARAIRCAEAIRTGVASLDIEVRAGLHTGEVELLDHDLGGVAVHIAARVSAKAGAGEVLVSSTVKDLVIGSDITFEDAGTHTLKGVPGEWHLLAVAMT